MFTNILLDTAGTATTVGALGCLLASLICGLIISLLYMYKSEYTRSFVIGLILLPETLAHLLP